MIQTIGSRARSLGVRVASCAIRQYSLKPPRPPSMPLSTPLALSNRQRTMA